MHLPKKPPRRNACFQLEPLESRELPSGLRAAIWAERVERRAALVVGEAREEARGIRVVRNVAFAMGPTGPLRLDLTLPAGEPPEGGWPVVVAIRGGGWKASSREAFRRDVAPLAAMGYAIVTPDYSPPPPGGSSWPRNFEDVADAVRWTRRSARRFDLDVDRIAALGWSSGGHLAALLGTYQEGLPASKVASWVSAVIDLSGPADLTSFATDASAGGASAAVQMMGGTPDETPDRYEAASPVSHVSPGDAPMLIIHGLKDSIVPAEQSRELAEALEGAGVDVELVLVPGGGHDLDPFGGGGLSGVIEAFLAERLAVVR